MLQIIEFQEDNIIGAKITGDIAGENAGSLVKLVNDKLAQHGKIRMYMEIDDIDSVTWEAIKAELKLKSELDSFSDFEKVAYVSDSALLGVASFVANLFPGIEAEHFKMAEKEKAKAWVKSNVSI